MIDITTSQQLQEFCDKHRNVPRLALDTEFIREKTYYPVLALIQVAVQPGQPVLIDPLEIDLKPLLELLADPAIQKVVHAGRQDMEIFLNLMGELPTNVFDTQVASAMLGFGEQIGYAALIQRTCQVELGKGARFTDWLSRPLHETQLDYARNDVRYLLQAHDYLQKQIEQLGRAEWVEDELAHLYTLDQFVEAPEDLWLKVKRWNTVHPRDYVVLQGLAAWRDAEARRQDRPVRNILSDEAMIELSRTAKLDASSLQSKRFAHGGLIRRFGDVLIEIHRAARAKPKSEWPVGPRPPIVSGKAEKLAEFAWLLVQDIAQDQQMTPTSLIGKRDLVQLVDRLLRGKEPDQDLELWRKELLVAPMRDLLSGQMALRIRNGAIEWFKAPQ